MNGLRFDIWTISEIRSGYARPSTLSSGTCASKDVGERHKDGSEERSSADGKADCTISHSGFLNCSIVGCRVVTVGSKSHGGSDVHQWANTDRTDK